jgi:two-component system CheB/CheR fusion protein
LAAAVWELEEPLTSQLEKLRASQDVGGHFDFEYMVPGDTPRVYTLHGSVLKPDGEMFLMVTVNDVTGHKELERLLKVERERLATEVASTTRELGRTQEELRALAGSLFTSHEDEHRRLARELHDDISQKLALMEMDAQQIVPRITTDAAKAAQEVEELRMAIGALSEEVRRISHALHPSVIDDLGIAAALRTQVEEFREREHMIATFSAQDLPDDIPVPVATGLYRIAQEALRNVSKHAGRTHVKVVLKGAKHALRLQVIDFGEGFDVHARRSGLGLVSMEERARLMEGTLAIESEPGEGTRITVDVPLPEAT